MRSPGLKLRLALLVTVLGLLQAVGVIAFSYLKLESELDAQARHVLKDKTQQARSLIDPLQDATEVRANAFKLVELLMGHAELHMGVASLKSGETYVAFSPEGMESLTRLRDDTWDTDAYLGWSSKSKRSRMLSLATAGTTRNMQPYEIVLTVDRSQDTRLLHELVITAGTAAPFAFAFLFLTAMFVVALGLKPLERFEHAVGGTSAKSLRTRLDTGGLPSELRGLAQAFNAMLDRLDDGVTRLSQFSGDLAHEMRTPLATLLGRTQVALSQPRSAEHLVDVLEGNVEELQRLSRLISDMLFLAQADNARSVLDLKKIALHEEAERIVDYLEPLAQERNISIVVQGKAITLADKGLVQRAITNLLSNAVRHGTRGTQVRVRVQTEAQGVRLDISNKGQPIAPSHLARIFDRFYRIDSARARDLGGTGLGLAIVRAVMTLHGGTAQVENTKAGEIVFTLVFPHTKPGI